MRIIILLFLLGVKTNPNIDGKIKSLDNIMLNNKDNFENTNKLSKQSDSIVSKKVDNTVQKITNLETQVKELKIQNNELKEKLLDAINDNGKPFKLEPVSPN